jgi:elongation factor P--beta-lysine ligase
MNIKTHVEHRKAHAVYHRLKKQTRDFLDSIGIMEVDVPVLSPALAPESYLEVFETQFRLGTQTQPLYLTPSPEIFLKRLLAHDMGDIFYLGKSFRNSDPTATLHSFEFTMLELYKMGSHYMDIADIVLRLLQYLAGGKSITYKGKNISFDRWEKLSVAEAFQKYADISEQDLFDQQLCMKRAKERGYRTEGFTYEDVWSQIYTQDVEPNLGMNGVPTLLYDYPKEFAALAALNKDGKTAQRFEFYIAGVELGDCYTELTDWKEQLGRFEQEQKKRKESDRITHPIDKGFIEALQYGLKPCAGIAIGFDRLAVIFANVSSLEETQVITISTD